MSLFSHRDYRHLFAAQVVALFGTGLTTVAAYQLAGADAAAVLGTALTIKMTAYVAFAPVAAAHADRFPRRLMLVSLDMARAAVAVALPFIDQVRKIYVLIAVLQSASAAYRCDRENCAAKTAGRSAGVEERRNTLPTGVKTRLIAAPISSQITKAALQR